MTRSTALVWTILFGLLTACGSVRADADAGPQAPAHCSDGVQGDGETDVDCGGPCPPCAVGKGCATGADCASGHCPADDGVCCDAACDATCVACLAAKTGAGDGACAPVAQGQDPDGECSDEGAASCGASGTGCNGSATSPGCNLYGAGIECGAAACVDGTYARASTCDGAGTCVAGATDSCSPYTCDGAGVACLDACGGPQDCVVGHGCDVGAGECRVALRVAVHAHADSCAREPGDILEAFVPLLTARGHVPTIVTAAEISELAEIQAYDVVVISPSGASCLRNELSILDPVIDAYLGGGGGIISTGWLLYAGILSDAPQIAAAMPAGRSSAYSDYPTFTPVAGHPISDGLAAFGGSQYSNEGAGTKDGATTILTAGDTTMGSAWEVGAGRAVYLAPIYLEPYEVYDNTQLLDGTEPSAIELILRAIEWAGGAL